MLLNFDELIREVINLKSKHSKHYYAFVQSPIKVVELASSHFSQFNSRQSIKYVILNQCIHVYIVLET